MTRASAGFAAGRCGVADRGCSAAGFFAARCGVVGVCDAASPPHPEATAASARARAEMASRRTGMPPWSHGSSAVHSVPGMGVEIRPARDGEDEAVASVLQAAGLGANVGRLLEYPRASPTGEVFAALHQGQLIGAAAVAGFGATGWIGALGVVASARRRGAGRTLTEACTDWLRERGASTVLLYATEAGRPVYQRVGFVVEGAAHAWRDVAPPPLADPPVGIRALGRADADDVRALDAAATGEDRSAVLSMLLGGGQNGAGIVVERN